MAGLPRLCALAALTVLAEGAAPPPNLVFILVVCPTLLTAPRH